MSLVILRATLSSLALVMACAFATRAEDGTPETLAQQKLNPLAYAINLPATLSFSFAHGQAVQPSLEFQPLIPLKLNGDWRLVTRSNVSIIHEPAPEEITGLSDTDVSLFLTPARTGPWVWGVGPIFEFPTASNTSLGSGKWSAGPTAALVYAGGPWVNGILVSQLWSFAGPRDREDVSVMEIEAQLSYTFSNGWYVLTNPTISCDWKAPSGQGWTVPVGAAVGKTFSIGSQGMSLQLGAYYNAKRPAGTPTWVLQTQFSLIY